MFQYWNLVFPSPDLFCIKHLCVYVCVCVLQLVRKPTNERASLAHMGWKRVRSSEIWQWRYKGHGGEKPDFAALQPHKRLALNVCISSLCLVLKVIFVIVGWSPTAKQTRVEIKNINKGMKALNRWLTWWGNKSKLFSVDFSSQSQHPCTFQFQYIHCFCGCFAVLSFYIGRFIGKAAQTSKVKDGFWW